MNPRWIKGYVESLNIAPYGRFRSDCPICSKPNTFSVSDNGFERLWFCFHADCSVKGATGISLTKENSKSAFVKREPKQQETDIKFKIPDTFVSLSRNINAENYVKKVHSYDAYLSGLVDIRYDFQRDRVAYLVKDGDKVVDATGRSLTSSKPKWLRYGNSKLPFTCGGSDIAILVEDCPSACSLAVLCTGIALMGTSLLDSHIQVIQNYKKIFVALDKDATRKAVDIVRHLSNYVPTRLVVLKKDLKNMEKEERDDFINNYISR
jgi:DNA primase